jgi:hypothetical protein
MWWFDIDYVLFDFIFDSFVCISYVFTFVIGFFFRLLFSFIFSILCIGNLFFMKLTFLHNFFYNVLCLVLYCFIQSFFTFNFFILVFLIEFIYLNYLIVFTDLTSISCLSFTCSLYTNLVCCYSCNFVFSLFYFNLIILFSFIFFLLRCLFSILFDYLFFNFDFFFSGNFLNLTKINFNGLYFLHCMVIIRFMVCFFFLGVLSVCCSFLVSLYFSMMFLIGKYDFLCIKFIWWSIISYIKSCSCYFSSVILFFKFNFNDIFFFYVFIFVIFICSFFGIIVKDFVFLSLFFDIFISFIFYNKWQLSGFSNLIINNKIGYLQTLQM